jgi:hypothetical protein
METEKVVIEAEVKVKGEGNVKSIKAELRQLKNELGRLDPDSQAFITAAQRAGVLQDQIEDINNTVKAFNPEAKFQAFAGVLGGVANGFSAIQGAQALFGAENEDVQKAILKTQGAIALATGLNGLMGMKDAFVILSQVIKAQVVSSFNTLGKAIRSTGIIALVATLGVLIYEWYKEAQATKDAAAAQEKLNEQIANYSDKIKELRIEGARGREKESLEQTKHYNDQLREIQKAVKEEVYTVEQGELLMAQIRANYALADKELRKKNAEEDRAEKIAAQKKLSEELIAEVEASSKGLEEKRLQIYSLELAQNQYFFDQKLISEKEYNTNRAKIEKSYTDFLVEQENLRKQARLDTLQATAAGINAVSQLVGEQTAAGKALGVASATIDTYVGANKALAQGGTLGFVAAGAVILQGLANVKRILAVKVPSINGTSANAMGNAPSSVPQMPNIYQSTQLNPNSTLNTRQLNVNDNRVYVLESDITGTQKKVERITRKATIR